MFKFQVFIFTVYIIYVSAQHFVDHIEYHQPHYQFNYGVEDHHTGDIKSQREERNGDIVSGEYKVLQPDGRTRIVHYTSDKHSGFNAKVVYTGHASHPEHNFH